MPHFIATIRAQRPTSLGPTIRKFHGYGETEAQAIREAEAHFQARNASPDRMGPLWTELSRNVEPEAK